MTSKTIHKKSPFTSLDKELQQVFMQFHKTISAGFRKETKHMPLTMSQLEALRYVVEQKNPTMKDVAAHLGVTAPSATAMIEQLSEKKLITRGFDSTDRRTIHIFPTAKGAKLLASFAETKSRVFGSVLAGLNVQDQKTLVAVLKKLI